MLNILGILATRQENCGHAEQYCEQILTVTGEIDDRYKVAESLYNLGHLSHHSTGNLEKAEQCSQESLLIGDGIGHRFGATGTLISLRQLHAVRGEYQFAWE